MRLKKLTILGFKSFADRITLHFDEGITGIVGPNGSGKSNVIDAVRWVMGEQNAKHLRGQVATDIIFAGSDQRKQLSMAEVTLVFDNTGGSNLAPLEYRHEEEISLTRRLYADGEREYLINRKDCRLKDIVNFFATTGLGGRSYSMIQQGQVDRILNAKPEDVREIIEEASGVQIFKARSTGAQKKLMETRDNLARVDDIVTELQTQLGSLESQVGKAKQWQLLQDDIKTTEIAQLAHQFCHSLRDLKSLDERLKDYEASEVTVFSEKSKIETRLEAKQLALAQADPEIETFRDQISQLREDIARGESSLLSAQQIVESCEERLGQLWEQHEQDEDEHRLAKLRVEELQQQLNGGDERIELLAEQMESFQDEVDRVGELTSVYKSRIAEISAAMATVSQALERNRLRFESVERDRKRTSGEMERAKEKLAEQERALTAAAEMAADFESQVGEAQFKLETVLADNKSILHRKTSLLEDLQQSERRYETLKSSVFTMRARHGAAEELAKEQGVSGLSPDSQVYQQPGVLGCLRDLVVVGKVGKKVFSDGHLRAFDQWAEAFLLQGWESVEWFLSDEGAAESAGLRFCILGMEEQSSGEADLTKQLSAFGSRLHCVGDLVDVSPSVPGLKAKLSFVFVVTGELTDEDLKEFSKFPEGCVLFTEKGGVIECASRVSVSSSQVSVLKQRMIAEELQQELSGVEQDYKEAEAHFRTLKGSLESLNEELKLGESKVRGNQDSVLGLLKEQQKAQQKVALIQSVTDQLVQQFEIAEEQNHRLEKEIKELGEARVSLGNERENLSEDLIGIEEEYASIDERTAEVRRLQEQRQQELTALRSKREFLQQSIIQNTEYVSTIAKRLASSGDTVDALKQKKENASKTFQEQGRQLAGWTRQREELEGQLSRKREQHSDLVDELKKLEESMKDLLAQEQHLNQEKTQAHLDKERLLLVIKSVAGQADEKYGLDVKTYEFDYKIDYDVNHAAAKVKRLRRDVEALGPVNMVAVDEYEKILERYQFMDSQKTEILDSIALLEQAISDIEENARDKFLNTFAAVSKNFTELFPVLFPNGDGQLVLASEEDPLNSGVEIMVRLPGKKQQRMNLFSGGEKALTAISLIFALLKTKPTPFCFLDEVDAPLDEANVGRYNAVLAKLSARFQFVVITHNRRTMEVLDQLYGITMEEGGVSKVVGVDLKKDIPTHLAKSGNLVTNEPVRVGATARP